MVCVWNVDTGAFKGPLTIMDVNTKNSGKGALEPLYFDEKGEIKI
jgi:hypothetical protein